MGKLADVQGDTAIALVFVKRGADWMAFTIYICAFLGITASSFTNVIVITCLILIHSL